MNKNLVEIAFVLDRSGSMGPLREQAIAGFNHFLADQNAQPGDARLTLVLFDYEYLVPVDARPLQDVAALDTTTYVPRGSTALLDAIGTTIDRLGQRLAATSAEERPGRVIVAILTDGEENASTRYDWPAIAARIRHQSEKYKWQFLFLGANQDAIATASKMNIDSSNAATFEASGSGLAASARALSRRTSAVRDTLASGRESADTAATMTQLLGAETGKTAPKKPKTKTARKPANTPVV